jgi:magnesium transporter
MQKDVTPNMEVIVADGLTWVNIENPSEEEINYLAENYPFHPLDLDDTVSRRQRPKFDTYKDYHFCVMHFPKYRKDERVISSSQVSAFIGKGYLITIHKGELKPLTKLFRECQIDEESRQEYFEFGSGFLLYSIVDRVIDYCQPIVGKIMNSLEDVEHSVFTPGVPPKSLIKTISTLRRDTFSIRHTMLPMRIIINSFEKNISRYVDKNLSEYFGDLVDHADHLWDALDEIKEVADVLFDTYFVLSMDRFNDIMRILAVLATIVTPITFISSIYGMNIELPIQNEPYAFPVIMGVMVAIIAGALYLFRKLHLI